MPAFPWKTTCSLRGLHARLYSQQFHNRRQTFSARTAVAQSAAGAPPRNDTLTIIHFNDVYNIEPRTIEPVGGAARFAHKVHSFKSENPLILFSGDCLNPSLLSAFTKGEQMIPVLNNIGVHAAAVGNHDFDFGVDVLRSHMWRFRFPWLLSNVLDSRTGKPLGGAQRSHIINHNGINIGLLGLVEREWLLTIPSIEADRDINFLDFVDEGQKLAHSLRENGADIIIALTHMRSHNDKLLAAAVPEIQLLLGGHDHDAEITETAPHGTLLIKSGTDFREFSHLKLTLPSSPTERLKIQATVVEITSNIPEDKQIAEVVSHYQALMGTQMDAALGKSFVDLDATFDCVRTRESNVGNLMGDIMRLSLGADVAFLNGGTIRSDQVHSMGKLSMRDFVTMLPFTDELVVVELSGSDLIDALETGLSSWPAKEGRFLQVSNISFTFDPTQPPGERVLHSSVTVGGTPIDVNASYKVATKAYLRSGKDGFHALKDAKVVVDGETAPRLATLVHYLLTRIEQLNQQRGPPGCDDGNGGKGADGPIDLMPVSEGPVQTERCAHGLDALYYYDSTSCTYGIAPTVEGRIQILVEDEGNGTDGVTTTAVPSTS